MISLDTWLVIRYLSKLGHSARHIAQELDLNPRTVRRALAQTSAPERVERAHPTWRALEPLRAELVEGLRHGHDGVHLLEQARQAGYGSSRASFYSWLADVKEQIGQGSAALSMRFETEPAHQCQFDWSPYVVLLGGVQVPIVVYSLLLGYSRRAHFHASLSEKLDAVLEGLEAGIWHFGGACYSVLVDNAKAMVLLHRRSHLQFGDAFWAFCGHYRIHPIAATPGHPQTKGKVENPFQSLEARFLKGGSWPDWEQFLCDLAAFEQRWEQRIHHTTKVAPAVRFLEEKPKLQPLPPRLFLGARSFVRQLNNDATFSFGGVRYCAPAERVSARTHVLVRTERGRHLAVYSQAGELLIRHALQPSGSPPVLAPECYEALRRRHLARLDVLLERFRQRYAAHSQAAEAFLGKLLAEHPNRPERSLGTVLELLSGAPDPIALAALAEAVELGLCSVQALEALLARHLRSQHTSASSYAPVLSLTGASAQPLEAPGPDCSPLLRTPDIHTIQDIHNIHNIQRPLDGYGRALGDGALGDGALGDTATTDRPTCAQPPCAQQSPGPANPDPSISHKAAKETKESSR